VESKATIQPFVTEEEAKSQRAWQLIRNEGSNGSYKRGDYRGNRSVKNSLQENILQSLMTTFTNMGLEIRVKRFTRTTEAIKPIILKESIVKK
jgi:hypothetical protein